MKKFLLFSVTVLLALLTTAQAQTLTVSTVAGNAGQTSSDGSGSSARFNNPWGVAVDASGNVYVADTDSHIIRKITSGGTVTTFAGTLGVSGTNDATGTSAKFNSPQGIVIDTLGNLYVTDSGNQTVRKITSLGVVTTLAGAPTVSGATDGTGSNARFNNPEGIAINSAGVLYVADTGNHTIRSVTSGGVVTTYAGTSGTPGSANLTGTSASFNTPQGIAIDSSGNIYVADTGNQLVRLISAGAVVSTYAGVSGTTGSNDGTTGSATFWDPIGVAVSGTTVYVADSFNNTIRKISAGSVTTPVGSAGMMGSADGTASAASFWQPQGVAVDLSGNVYVADGGNGTIRKIAGTSVTTLAGSPSIGSADGNSLTSRFFFPAGICIDSSGNTYVADTQNHTIRSVTSAGTATTLAGTAGVSGAANGSGSAARFNAPQGIARDSSGNLYVADTGNHIIRKITGTSVSLLAGTAGTSGVADGTGSAAQFNYPEDVAVDASGNVYVADTWNHTIRKITSAGVVTTLAGVPGTSGDTDGTGANVGTNAARFYAPGGVCVDASGNIFVADTYNHTIRKVTSAGVVSTIAGLGGSYGADDGSNNSARFFLPRAISVDSGGNLFVLDSGNHTLRKLTPSGTNWIVTTVAGMAGLSGSANGLGSAARFFSPAGLDINSSGTLAIADLGNNLVRYASGSAPTITGQPQSETVVRGQTASFSVTATGPGTLSYQWYFNSGTISGASTSSYTKANVQTTDAGSYSVIVSNPGGTTASANAILTVTVPPTITTGPQSETVTAGTSATFSVTASGTTPFSYQWYFGASPISGATASTYTVNNAQSANAGNYSVVVTNVAGTATSGSAGLTVTPASPTITQQPQSQGVGQGSSATFSVTATGTTPMSYQWKFNNSAIGGATTSTYTIPNVQPANAGSYSVIITNSVGSATSATATLTILVPPVIGTQPQSQLTFVGSNVTFNVVLSQGTNVSYQWQQNGTPIAGATLSSYQIAAAQWADAGSYNVVVTNGAGTVTSSTATLVVQQAPTTFFDGFETYNLGFVDNNTSGGPNPNSPWWSLSTTVGQGVVTNASTGVTPHTGAQMLGTSVSLGRQDYYNLTYRLNAGQLLYGNFMCDWWFYDPYGTAAGSANMQEYLALSECGNVPTNSDSTSQLIPYNQRVSLGCYNGNTGYNSNVYQARIIGGTGGTFGSGNSWYNTPVTRTIGWHHARIVAGIPDATNMAPIWMYLDDMTNATVYSPTIATYGFNLIELNHDVSSKTGAYGYYDDLTFRVADDPWIVEQPQSTTVVAGNATTLTTVAIGTGYQWRLNGSPISAATTSAYTIASATGADAGSYTCAITGTNGTINTSTAIVTVTGLPNITSQPSSQTVNQGQNATFSVSATGVGPISYQWRFNNANISGANSSSYTKANAQSSDVGSYTVVVSNVGGSATSSPATLTVLVPPSITSQPSSVTVLQGATASFKVTATGATGYQWTFKGTPIANATTSSYQKQNAQTSDAGSYAVVVSNSGGSVTSASAILTVLTGTTGLSSITANPNNTVTMVWQVSPTTNYSLQYKSNLLDAQWNTINNFSPGGSTLTVSDGPVTDGQRSYQLASAQNISDIGGLLRMTLLGNSDNIISIPFGRAPALLVLVGSTSGNVIAVSSSPGWTANQFVYASGTQTNTYFVRFTSGAAAGRIYPITANDANTLTVNLGSDTLASVTRGDAFAIEAYWTLNTVFPNGAGVNVSPTVGNRNTEVLIPDLTTSGINLSAAKIYYFNGGLWKQVGQGSASHNDDILQPNAFLIVRHNVATNTVLTSVGRVISSTISITMQTQTGTQQDNCIGLQRPVAVSLNDSGLISSGAFSASPLPGSRTDELLTFDNSVVARNKSSSASYYYWSGAWRQVGAGNTDVGTNEIFQPGTGIIIRKGTNNVSPVWTNSATWTQ